MNSSFEWSQQLAAELCEFKVYTTPVSEITETFWNRLYSVLQDDLAYDNQGLRLKKDITVNSGYIGLRYIGMLDIPELSGCPAKICMCIPESLCITEYRPTWILFTSSPVYPEGHTTLWIYPKELATKALGTLLLISNDIHYDSGRRMTLMELGAKRTLSRSGWTSSAGSWNPLLALIFYQLNRYI